MKSQIENIKENEKTYHNIPDPVFLYDAGEGQVARSILTSFIREFVWKKKRNEKDKNILQTQQRLSNLFLTWENLLNLCYIKNFKDLDKRGISVFLHYF